MWNIIPNWTASATQAPVEDAFRALIAPWFIIPVAIASISSCIAILLIRKDRGKLREHVESAKLLAREMGYAKGRNEGLIEGKENGRVAGFEEGFQKGQIAGTQYGIEQGIKSGKPVNAWDDYRDIIQVLAQRHTKLSSIIFNLSCWKEDGRVSGSATIAAPITRAWHRMLYPMIQFMFKEKHVTDSDFRYLLHCLNEFSNELTDLCDAYTFVEVAITESSKDSTSIQVGDGLGIPTMHSIYLDWNGTIDYVHKSILAWNTLNPERKEIVWGWTMNEHLTPG